MLSDDRVRCPVRARPPLLSRGEFAREGLEVPVEDLRQRLRHRPTWRRFPSGATPPPGAKVPRSMTRTPCRALPPDGRFPGRLGPTPLVNVHLDPGGPALPVGPISGLNYAAAVQAAQRLGPDAQVVTVFPDRMERYFSTEFFRRPASSAAAETGLSTMAAAPPQKR